jgi:hypothetical protein
LIRRSPKLVTLIMGALGYALRKSDFDPAPLVPGR